MEGRGTRQDKLTSRLGGAPKCLWLINAGDAADWGKSPGRLLDSLLCSQSALHSTHTLFTLSNLSPLSSVVSGLFSLCVISINHEMR